MRLAVGAVAVVLLLVALAVQWSKVRAHAGELSLAPVLAAFGCGVAALFCSLFSWRSLLADLGSALPLGPSLRVFFLGQLAKYIPGSVWSIAAQVELGRDHEVPRARSAAAAGVGYVVSPAVGLLVALGTLPLVARTSLAAYVPTLLALPLLLVLLHPRVLTPLLQRALRLARRQPLDRGLSYGGVLQAAGWQALAFAAYGAQVWLLAVDLGAERDLLPLLALGAFALAWSAGFLFVIAPSGAGVREVALVALLASALPAAAATVLALVARLLAILADVLAGALGALAVRSRRR